MPLIKASSTISYEIPDEWWDFCEMSNWKPQIEFYVARELNDADVELVKLVEIEPIQRDLGNGSSFRKFKLVPILLRLTDPRCYLAPIELKPLVADPRYKYQLVDGFHRFVASIAVGYQSIPARINRLID